MDRPRRLTFVAVALAATTLFAACGDDDDSTASTSASTTASTSGASASTSGSETTGSTASTATSGSGGEVGSKQDYVDAAESAIQFEDEEIRGCVAEALVSDDVYAAIQKVGLSLDDFKSGDSMDQLKVTEDQATSIADDIAACGDLLPQILSDDEDQLNCAKESLSNEQVGQLLSYSLFRIDLPEDLKTANTAIQACVEATASPSTAVTSTTS
jgi:hypothetical protein